MSVYEFAVESAGYKTTPKLMTLTHALLSLFSKNRTIYHLNFFNGGLIQD